MEKWWWSCLDFTFLKLLKLVSTKNYLKKIQISKQWDDIRNIQCHEKSVSIQLLRVNFKMSQRKKEKQNVNLGCLVSLVLSEAVMIQRRGPDGEHVSKRSSNFQMGPFSKTCPKAVGLWSSSKLTSIICWWIFTRYMPDFLPLRGCCGHILRFDASENLSGEKQNIITPDSPGFQIRRIVLRLHVVQSSAFAASVCYCDLLQLMSPLGSMRFDVIVLCWIKSCRQ